MWVCAGEEGVVGVCVGGVGVSLCGVNMWGYNIHAYTLQFLSVGLHACMHVVGCVHMDMHDF